MKNYTPAPIDTSEVELTEDLLHLAELLAENTHEVYCKGRFAEGWTYGPQRNDELKTNPTLIPYGELSESEKDYDRNTAIETIKVLVKLGYKIQKGDN